MAGAGGFALGGPRFYSGKVVQQGYFNSPGKAELDAADIASALQIFGLSCFSLWTFVLLMAVLL